MKKFMIGLNVFFGLIYCLVFRAPALLAEGGGIATDPMVKITSLPTKLDVKAVLKKVSDDVSRDIGLDKNMVTYYWQTFDYIYCPGCENAGIEDNIIFIDLYVPGFMPDDEIGKVMTSLAISLEKHAGINRKSLFIHAHVAEENRLYMMGEVITDWSQVGGPTQEPSPAGKQPR